MALATSAVCAGPFGAVRVPERPVLVDCGACYQRKGLRKTSNAPVNFNLSIKKLQQNSSRSRSLSAFVKRKIPLWLT